MDDDGLGVAKLGPSTRFARIVSVTPSHQFPTGGIMSLARRLALLKDAPDGRPIERPELGTVIEMPEVGGLSQPTSSPRPAVLPSRRTLSSTFFRGGPDGAPSS